jgi:L-fuculose-phosphate aldolase
MLRRFDAGSLDLILAEGFKHASYPKIEIYRIPAAGSPLYRLDANVIAVVTNGTLPEENHPPALPLADPQAVADFVQRYIASWSPPHSLGPSQDLVRYYRWLRQHGCNDSHSGNASVRMGERFLITPTGACADTLEPSELLSCPLAGPCPQSASLDAPLHQLVYQRQPEAKAVLHSHGPYSVAMSLAGADFLPIDFEGQSYFARVPVLTVPVAEYAHKAPGAVAAALAEHPIVMVRGHGVYAWGHTLNRAYKWTCSLELSAKTFFIATRLVDP